MVLQSNNYLIYFIRNVVQPEDLKIEFNLNSINLSPINGENAQQQVEIENKRHLNSNQRNMRLLQLQENWAAERIKFQRGNRVRKVHCKTHTIS